MRNDKNNVYNFDFFLHDIGHFTTMQFSTNHILQLQTFCKAILTLKLSNEFSVHCLNAAVCSGSNSCFGDDIESFHELSHQVNSLYPTTIPTTSSAFNLDISTTAQCQRVALGLRRIYYYDSKDISRLR